ncbi:MAG: hypothetical protein HFI68_01745 [Lachnospiraceae bacterium]|nr:hypothetical protein [Lachnospiraceae bacterium]
MRKTMEKGIYGYGKKKLMRQCFLCAICLVLSFGAVLIGYLATGKRTSIWTIGAVFPVIPAATFLVNIVARCKGLPLKKEEYKRFAEVAGGQVTACDMILTANQKLVPIQASVFHEMGIAAYTTSKKLDIKETERDVNGLLKSVGIYSKIQIFTDYEAFLKRVKGLKTPASPEEQEAFEKKRQDLLVYSM